MSNLPPHQRSPFPGDADAPLQYAEPAPRPVHQKRQRARGPPALLRDYLTRAELLELVPLSMSTIDNLEHAGVFPSRFKIDPTTRVAWRRKEVERFMEQRAAKRVHKGEQHPRQKIRRSGCTQRRLVTELTHRLEKRKRNISKQETER
jgi:prophage regulatory protein